MAKYITKLRRGIRYVDETGATLLNSDGTPVKDDWTTYTAKYDHKDPQDCELVAEFEVMHKDGKPIKTTPRLKIGDGKNTFANLEYISVDSFILPTKSSITIYPDKWDCMTDENGEAIANRYTQSVTVENAIVTPNSQIDLQPTPQDLVTFHEKDLTFVAVNKNCNVRVCLVGEPPANEYTFMATVTELTDVTTDEIVGNTTATPNPKPDWTQIDETKADYIKNKPELGALAGKSRIEWTDLSEELQDAISSGGSGSSTNDYTDEDKNKLAGIEAGAEVNVQSDWAQNDPNADDYIKNKPTLGALAAKSTVGKDDLTDDVKESLEKADSAVQSLNGYATEKYVDDAVSGIEMPDTNKQIEAHNTSNAAHNDIRLQITKLTNSVPKKTSELTNDSGYITSAPVTSVNNKTGAVNITASDLTTDSTHRFVTDNEKSTWNAKANSSDIPTRVSQLTNDSNYLTSETDPTVPDWAKQPNKPTYTASEVGAVPTTRTINDKALSDNISLTASDVGAVPTSRKVNNKALSADITLAPGDIGAAPAYTYGTADLTAGSSSLATGTIYFVYE